MWNIVAAEAAEQHGAVSRRALISAEIPGPTIDAWLAAKRLRREDHGVYVVTGAPATPLQEVMVAVLRAGAGARAVGPRLLGALGVRDVEPDASFEVLVPRGRRLPAARFAWRRDPYPELGQRATVVGVPTFTHARNLVEAAVSPIADRDLRRLSDGVRWAKGSLADVSALLEAQPAHPGLRRLVLLGLLDADAAESEGERRLEVILRPYAARRQVRVSRDLRVDFLIPRGAVVVEHIGAPHGSDAARSGDGSRASRVRRLGYGYVESYPADLRDPTDLLDRIELAIELGTRGSSAS